MAGLSGAWGALIAAGGAVFGGGGVWTWITSRQKAKADAPGLMIGNMAELQSVLNQQASNLNRAMESRCRELEGRINALEDENDHCRGENRQLRQRVDSLEAFLRRQGIDIPGGPEGALVTIEDGKATVFKPDQKRSRQ